MNFVFPLTKIVFGDGVSTQVGTHLLAMGARKTLCIYDRGIKDAGLVDPVIEAMELAAIEVEGQAGAGMVKVTMTCKHDVRRVQIDDSVMDDREMLEDLLAAAVNDAVRRVEATTAEKMAGFSAGLNLPPGFKMPF